MSTDTQKYNIALKGCLLEYDEINGNYIINLSGFNIINMDAINQVYTISIPTEHASIRTLDSPSHRSVPSIDIDAVMQPLISESTHHYDLYFGNTSHKDPDIDTENESICNPKNYVDTESKSDEDIEKEIKFKWTKQATNTLAECDQNELLFIIQSCINSINGMDTKPKSEKIMIEENTLQYFYDCNFDGTMWININKEDMINDLFVNACKMNKGAAETLYDNINQFKFDKIIPNQQCVVNIGCIK